jgi:bacteriocin biosynthesis cyclodehydratase domain-containing protein
LADTPAKRSLDTPIGIAEGLDLVVISADEVLVQFGTRSHPSELLRDDDLNGTLGTLVARLQRGPASLSELLDEVVDSDRAEAGDLIEDLLQHGTLADARRTPVEQYLKYTFSDETSLADRRVSLLGAGPTGGRLAHSLLQHGLGDLGLLDDREVDALWHSFLGLVPAPDPDLAATADIALRDQLRAAGHFRVEALDGELDLSGIEAAVRRSDIVVLALEQPDIRLAHMVNRVCLRERKPWLLATIDGNFGLVGPLFVPPHTACYNDYRALADAATPSPEMARKHRQHIIRRRTGSFFPGLPSYAEIVAGHATLAVVNFLIRGHSFALGRVLVIDFDRMVIDVEDVLKLPRCPVCGVDRATYRLLAPVDGRTNRGAGDDISE